MKHSSVPSLGGTGRQEQVNAHFQKTSAHWREVYGSNQLGATIYQERKAAVLAMVDELHLAPDSRVLEVGCGAGVTSVALAQRGYLVQAIDSVPAMIEQTRQTVSENAVSGRVRAGLADVHSLPFPDGLFDLVLAVGVLAWMDSPAQPLREMLRVARPGAYLILTVANRWRLDHVLDPRCFPPLRPIRRKVHGFLERLGLCRPPAKPRHAVYSRKEFDALLLAEGAQRIRGTTLGFGPFTFLNFHLFSDFTGVRIHRRLQALADRGTPALRSTGVSYLALAQKPSRR